MHVAAVNNDNTLGNVVPCAQPPNTVGIITRLQVDDPTLITTVRNPPVGCRHRFLERDQILQLVKQSIEVGTCTCAGNTVEHFYTPYTDANGPAGNGWFPGLRMSPAVKARRRDPPACVCTGTGECHQPIGIASFVNVVPFCDPGGCFFYATLNCNLDGNPPGTPVADPNSGLVNIATVRLFFTCAQQAAQPAVGSNSPYLKVATYSCNGQCLNGCIQCAGQFDPGGMLESDAGFNVTSSWRLQGNGNAVVRIGNGNAHADGVGRKERREPLSSIEL